MERMRNFWEMAFVEESEESVTRTRTSPDTASGIVQSNVSTLDSVVVRAGVSQDCPLSME